MDGEFLKFALTALGSGGLVAALIKVIAPALKLSQAGNESSGRAIAQWERLYAEQKEETAAALAALVAAKEQASKAEIRVLAAERRMRDAERRTDDLTNKLAQAVERIRLIEQRQITP
jgi:phosphopantetheinyl transferase (holo-ACP synthase)